jgi:hypothetical protein
VTNVDNDKDTHTLVNIYGPAKHQHRKPFYEELNTLLRLRYQGQTIVLGGDFNNTLNDKDTSSQTKQHGHYGQTQPLRNTIVEYDLIDSYRQLHPDGKDFTHTDPTHAERRTARLDRFYTNSNYTIHRVKHLNDTTTYTDHKAVVIDINGNPTEDTHRRSPHWKFNNSLLMNKTVTDSLTRLINGYTQQLPTENIAEYWDLLKNTIKVTTQQLARKISKQAKAQKQLIEDAIRLTIQIDTHAPQLESLRAELDKHNRHSYTGALIRTRQHTIAQETPNRQYLEIEQNIHRNRRIHNIMGPQGDHLTNNTEIAQAFHDYYTQLYTADTSTPTSTRGNFLTHAKQLEDTEKASLDKPLEITDLQKALNTLKLKQISRTGL